MTGKPRRTIILVVALAAIVSACGSAAGTPAGTTSTKVIELSRTKDYHSIAELKRDSDVIVLATATKDTTLETSTGGLPSTITVVLVRKVIRGSVGGASTVKLRQIGGPGTLVTDGAPLVAAGTSYLIFADRFTLTPGTTTDQYVVVGVAAGLFRDDQGIETPLDLLSPDLPKGLTMAQLESAIGMT